MHLTRRGVLGGLLASALAAPAVIRTPGLLMPVKRAPETFTWSGFYTRIPYAQMPSEADLKAVYALYAETIRFTLTEPRVIAWTGAMSPLSWAGEPA